MDLINLFKKYEKDLLKDTIELLKIPSVLDENDVNTPFGIHIKESLIWFLDMAKKDGFTVKNIDDMAGHIEYGEGEEIVGVLCHLDVVPVNDKLWDTPPFDPTIIDGKLYARGAMDDKGPTMAAYYALKMLKDLNLKTNKRIRLILGCDEETAWRGIKNYFEKEKMPDVGFSPDAQYPLIYGEKGIINFNIKGKIINSKIIKFSSGNRYNVIPDTAEVILNNTDLSEKYKIYLEKNNYKGTVDKKDNHEILISYGKSGHGSTPEVGLNAGYILIDFLSQNLNDNFLDFMKNNLTWDLKGDKMGIDFYQKDWGTTTNNLGIFEILDNNIKLGLNFRYPIDYKLEKNLDKLKIELKKFGLEIEVTDKMNKPHFVPLEDDLVKTLMDSYSKYTNDIKSKPFTIGGGTYSRSMEKCVAFGPCMPGKDGLIHQPNENIEINDLNLSVIIYADAISKLAK